MSWRRRDFLASISATYFAAGNSNITSANFFSVKRVRFLSRHDGFPKTSEPLVKISERCRKRPAIFRRPLKAFAIVMRSKEIIHNKSEMKWSFLEQLVRSCESGVRNCPWCVRSMSLVRETRASWCVRVGRYTTWQLREKKSGMPGISIHYFPSMRRSFMAEVDSVCRIHRKDSSHSSRKRKTTMISCVWMYYTLISMINKHPAILLQQERNPRILSLGRWHLFSAPRNLA